jgi:uncharacterized protein (TIGR00369 family)
MCTGSIRCGSVVSGWGRAEMTPNTRADAMDASDMSAMISRIRASFARQAMMATLGAELVAVRQGEVEIAMPFRADLTQQHGFLHAAAVSAIADSACGYAALSVMPAESEVLAVEFKVNLLSPAVGERFVASGRVLRSGRTITVCSGEVHATQGDTRKLICVLQGTYMTSRPAVIVGER